MIARLSVVLMLVVTACGGGSGDNGPSFAKDHPKIYLATNRARLTTALATSAGQRFQKMVDSWVGGNDVYGFERWNAALVGQLTSDPKYCTAAVKSIDADVTAAQTAISGGSPPPVADDDYLQVGDTVGDLALVYDWCYSTLTSDQRTAWLTYANQAVMNVWNPNTAEWSGSAAKWDGWAIDDPEDNYYYSFLRATMLLGVAENGDNTEGQQWIDQFHDTKLVGELIPAFNRDLVGGASREGTGYGVSLRGLWELYDLWQGSTGENLSTMSPQTRASMLAFIHQILPTLDRVDPTGDQSRDSTASFFDYHRDYLQELVTLFPSDSLAPRVQALLAASSVPQMTEEFMYAYDMIYANPSVTASQLDGLGSAYYAPGIGQVYARSGWDKHATWINLTAGPYTETHAHQDQGALQFFKDGWLAMDAGIDSHSGLRQEVGAHGILRVDSNGTGSGSGGGGGGSGSEDGGSGTITQQLGTSSTVLALHSGTNWLHVAADITPVYANNVGLISKMQREIVYLAPDCVVVYDRATTAGTTTQVWQTPMPATPTITGANAAMTASGHTLNIARLSPASGVTASAYDYTADSDFSTAFRYDESMAGGDNRWLHVIYADTAVSGITAVDANTVSLMLADGTAIQVGFNANTVGGTLTINGTATTLGAGIDTLPE